MTTTRLPFLVTVSILSLLAAPTLAAEKSELVLAIGGEPDTGYDPLLGWGRYGHPLFQSTLLSRDADLVTQPDLATAWTLSDDKLTWTITIREGVTFSDGTPLTAKDVAFTFTRAATAGGALDLTAMVSAEATDDRTVVIKLKQPWITFSENFYSLGIVPAATYGANYAREPIGSGPYRLVSWMQGEQLIVEANPNYYGRKSPFSRLTFLFTGEDTSLAAAGAGQVDMVSVPVTLADAVPAGFTTVVVDTVDNRGIHFPMAPDEGKKDAKGNALGNSVTADLAIRRAINIGIDRQKIVDTVLMGHGTPAYGPADGLPWSNPQAAVTYDLEAAKSLLDKAGWAPGADGIREKNGLRAAFPINYPASDSTRQAISVVLADLLKPLGIEAKPTGTTWETIERVMHSQPVAFGWGSHSPLEVYSLYQSGWGGVDYYNPGFFSNAAVDGHFEAAQHASSLEASYPEWQKAEWDGATGFSTKGEAGWAWLVNLDHVYFVNKCLDVGKTQIEPHGHGWPITAGIQGWTWTCD
jgi:peptide/nickel transport system substrate-binding protein